MRSTETVSRASRKAYTLVELMISSGLLAMVLVSIVGTFMVFARGAKGVAAYTEMSQQSRKALELFARDLRAAEDVTKADQYNLYIDIPETVYYGGESVQYVFDKDFGIFSRVEYDKDGKLNSNDVLLDGVEQFMFGFYDPLGQRLDYSQESLLLSVKSVQIDSEMVRDVSQTDATDYIISARFMMRNRPLTE